MAVTCAARTDEEIVTAVLDGEVDQFAGLIERYQHAAVRMAFHLVRDRDSAEDLAQEVFVDAYRQLGKLRHRGKFKSWFFSILHKKCLKHVGRQRGEVSLDEISAEDWIATESAATDSESDLLDLLNRLPLQYREVLALKYLSELDYEEIAEALGTTVGNVRVRCLRAKQRLREMFEREQRNAKVNEDGL